MWKLFSTDFTGMRSTLYLILLVLVALASSVLTYYVTSKAYQKTLSDVSQQLGSTTAQLITKQETLDGLADKAVEVKDAQQEGLKLAAQLEIRYRDRDRVIVRYRDAPLTVGETDCTRARDLAAAYFEELRNETK